MNHHLFIVLSLIVVQNCAFLTTNTALDLTSKGNPVLISLLQTIDNASSDQRLLDVSLQLLKSLCVCMRETLKVKKLESVSFSDGINSLQTEDGEDSSRRVLDLYQHIYNKTCFDLKNEVALKVKKSANVLSGEEKEFMMKSDCGKTPSHAITKTYGVEKHVNVTYKSNYRLEDILYQVFIKTRNYHKFRTRKYNLFQNQENPTRIPEKHNIIVILTLHPPKDIINLDDNCTKLFDKLNNTLHTHSPIDIDIIDTRYDQKENEEPKAATDCILKSIYTSLLQSEKHNRTKVFKLMHRNNTIKVYIDIIAGPNHVDYTKTCCNNKTDIHICKVEFTSESVESKETTTSPSTTTNLINFKDTISKIKTLVQLYDEKLKIEKSKRSTTIQVSKSRSEKFTMDSNINLNLTTTDNVISNDQEIETVKTNRGLNIYKEGDTLLKWSKYPLENMIESNDISHFVSSKELWVDRISHQESKNKDFKKPTTIIQQPITSRHLKTTIEKIFFRTNDNFVDKKQLIKIDSNLFPKNFKFYRQINSNSEISTDPSHTQENENLNIQEPYRTTTYRKTDGTQDMIPLQSESFSTTQSILNYFKEVNNFQHLALPTYGNISDTMSGHNDIPLAADYRDDIFTRITSPIENTLEIIVTANNKQKKFTFDDLFEKPNSNEANKQLETAGKFATNNKSKISKTSGNQNSMPTFFSICISLSQNKQHTHQTSALSDNSNKKTTYVSSLKYSSSRKPTTNHVNLAGSTITPTEIIPGLSLERNMYVTKLQDNYSNITYNNATNRDNMTIPNSNTRLIDDTGINFNTMPTEPNPDIYLSTSKMFTTSIINKNGYDNILMKEPYDISESGVYLDLGYSTIYKLKETTKSADTLIDLAKTSIVSTVYDDLPDKLTITRSKRTSKADNYSHKKPKNLSYITKSTQKKSLEIRDTTQKIFKHKNYNESLAKTFMHTKPSINKNNTYFASSTMIAETDKVVLSSVITNKTVQTLPPDINKINDFFLSTAEKTTFTFKPVKKNKHLAFLNRKNKMSIYPNKLKITMDGNIVTGAAVTIKSNVNTNYSEAISNMKLNTANQRNDLDKSKLEKTVSNVDLSKSVRPKMFEQIINIARIPTVDKKDSVGGISFTAKFSTSNLDTKKLSNVSKSILEDTTRVGNVDEYNEYNTSTPLSTIPLQNSLYTFTQDRAVDTVESKFMNTGTNCKTNESKENLITTKLFKLNSETPFNNHVLKNIARDVEWEQNAHSLHGDSEENAFQKPLTAAYDINSALNKTSHSRNTEFSNFKTNIGKVLPATSLTNTIYDAKLSAELDINASTSTKKAYEYKSEFDAFIKNRTETNNLTSTTQIGVLLEFGNSNISNKRVIKNDIGDHTYPLRRTFVYKIEPFAQQSRKNITDLHINPFLFTKDILNKKSYLQQQIYIKPALVGLIEVTSEPNDDLRVHSTKPYLDNDLSTRGDLTTITSAAVVDKAKTRTHHQLPLNVYTKSSDIYTTKLHTHDTNKKFSQIKKAELNETPTFHKNKVMTPTAIFTDTITESEIGIRKHTDGFDQDYKNIVTQNKTSFSNTGSIKSTSFDIKYLISGTGGGSKNQTHSALSYPKLSNQSSSMLIIKDDGLNIYLNKNNWLPTKSIVNINHRPDNATYIGVTPLNKKIEHKMNLNPNKNKMNVFTDIMLSSFKTDENQTALIVKTKTISKSNIKNLTPTDFDTKSLYTTKPYTRNYGDSTYFDPFDSTSRPHEASQKIIENTQQYLPIHNKNISKSLLKNETQVHWTLKTSIKNSNISTYKTINTGPFDVSQLKTTSQIIIKINNQYPSKNKQGQSNFNIFFTNKSQTPSNTGSVQHTDVFDRKSSYTTDLNQNYYKNKTKAYKFADEKTLNKENISRLPGNYQETNKSAFIDDINANPTSHEAPKDVIQTTQEPTISNKPKFKESTKKALINIVRNNIKPNLHVPNHNMNASMIKFDNLISILFQKDRSTEPSNANSNHNAKVGAHIDTFKVVSSFDKIYKNNIDTTNKHVKNKTSQSEASDLNNLNTDENLTPIPISSQLAIDSRSKSRTNVFDVKSSHYTKPFERINCVNWNEVCENSLTSQINKNFVSENKTSFNVVKSANIDIMNLIPSTYAKSTERMQITESYALPYEQYLSDKDSKNTANTNKDPSEIDINNSKDTQSDTFKVRDVQASRIILAQTGHSSDVTSRQYSTILDTTLSYTTTSHSHLYLQNKTENYKVPLTVIEKWDDKVMNENKISFVPEIDPNTIESAFLDVMNSVSSTLANPRERMQTTESYPLTYDQGISGKSTKKIAFDTKKYASQLEINHPKDTRQNIIKINEDQAKKMSLAQTGHNSKLASFQYNTVLDTNSSYMTKPHTRLHVENKTNVYKVPLTVKEKIDESKLSFSPQMDPNTIESVFLNGLDSISSTYANPREIMQTESYPLSYDQGVNHKDFKNIDFTTNKYLKESEINLPQETRFNTFQINENQATRIISASTGHSTVLNTNFSHTTRPYTHLYLQNKTDAYKVISVVIKKIDDKVINENKISFLPQIDPNTIKSAFVDVTDSIPSTHNPSPMTQPYVPAEYHNKSDSQFNDAGLYISMTESNQISPTNAFATINVKGAPLEEVSKYTIGFTEPYRSKSNTHEYIDFNDENKDKDQTETTFLFQAVDTSTVKSLLQTNKYHIKSSYTTEPNKYHHHTNTSEHYDDTVRVNGKINKTFTNKHKISPVPIRSPNTIESAFINIMDMASSASDPSKVMTSNTQSYSRPQYPSDMSLSVFNGVDLNNLVTESKRFPKMMIAKSNDDANTGTHPVYGTSAKIYTTNKIPTKNKIGQPKNVANTVNTFKTDKDLTWMTILTKAVNESEIGSFTVTNVFDIKTSYTVKPFQSNHENNKSFVLNISNPVYIQSKNKKIAISNTDNTKSSINDYGWTPKTSFANSNGKASASTYVLDKIGGSAFITNQYLTEPKMSPPNNSLQKKDEREAFTGVIDDILSPPNKLKKRTRSSSLDSHVLYQNITEALLKDNLPTDFTTIHSRTSKTSLTNNNSNDGFQIQSSNNVITSKHIISTEPRYLNKNNFLTLIQTESNTAKTNKKTLNESELVSPVRVYVNSLYITKPYAYGYSKNKTDDYEDKFPIRDDTDDNFINGNKINLLSDNDTKNLSVSTPRVISPNTYFHTGNKNSTLVNFKEYNLNDSITDNSFTTTTGLENSVNYSDTGNPKVNDIMQHFSQITNPYLRHERKDAINLTNFNNLNVFKSNKYTSTIMYSNYYSDTGIAINSSKVSLKPYDISHTTNQYPHIKQKDELILKKYRNFTVLKRNDDGTMRLAPAVTGTQTKHLLYSSEYPIRRGTETFNTNFLVTTHAYKYSSQRAPSNKIMDFAKNIPTNGDELKQKLTVNRTPYSHKRDKNIATNRNTANNLVIPETSYNNKRITMISVLGNKFSNKWKFNGTNKNPVINILETRSYNHDESEDISYSRKPIVSIKNVNVNVVNESATMHSYKDFNLLIPDKLRESILNVSHSPNDLNSNSLSYSLTDAFGVIPKNNTLPIENLTQISLHKNDLTSIEPYSYNQNKDTTFNFAVKYQTSENNLDRQVLADFLLSTRPILNRNESYNMTKVNDFNLTTTTMNSKILSKKVKVAANFDNSENTTRHLSTDLIKTIEDSVTYTVLSSNSTITRLENLYEKTTKTTSYDLIQNSTHVSNILIAPPENDKSGITQMLNRFTVSHMKINNATTVKSNRLEHLLADDLSRNQNLFATDIVIDMTSKQPSPITLHILPSSEDTVLNKDTVTFKTRRNYVKDIFFESKYQDTTPYSSKSKAHDLMRDMKAVLKFNKNEAEIGINIKKQISDFDLKNDLSNKLNSLSQNKTLTVVNESNFVTSKQRFVTGEKRKERKVITHGSITNMPSYNKNVKSSSKIIRINSLDDTVFETLNQRYENMTDKVLKSKYKELVDFYKSVTNVRSNQYNKKRTMKPRNISTATATANVLDTLTSKFDDMTFEQYTPSSYTSTYGNMRQRETLNKTKKYFKNTSATTTTKKNEIDSEKMNHKYSKIFKPYISVFSNLQALTDVKKSTSNTISSFSKDDALNKEYDDPKIIKIQKLEPNVGEVTSKTFNTETSAFFDNLNLKLYNRTEYLPKHKDLHDNDVGAKFNDSFSKQEISTEKNSNNSNIDSELNKTIPILNVNNNRMEDGSKLSSHMTFFVNSPHLTNNLSTSTGNPVKKSIPSISSANSRIKLPLFTSSETHLKNISTKPDFQENGLLTNGFTSLADGVNFQIKHEIPDSNQTFADVTNSFDVMLVHKYHLTSSTNTIPHQSANYNTTKSYMDIEKKGIVTGMIINDHIKAIDPDKLIDHEKRHTISPKNVIHNVKNEKLDIAKHLQYHNITASGISTKINVNNKKLVKPIVNNDTLLNTPVFDNTYNKFGRKKYFTKTIFITNRNIKQSTATKVNLVKSKLEFHTDLNFVSAGKAFSINSSNKFSFKSSVNFTTHFNQTTDILKSTFSIPNALRRFEIIKPRYLNSIARNNKILKTKPKHEATKSILYNTYNELTEEEITLPPDVRKIITPFSTIYTKNINGTKQSKSDMNYKLPIPIQSGDNLVHDTLYHSTNITYLHPIETLPTKTKWKSLKHIKLKNRNDAVIAMNTKDFLSHRQMVTSKGNVKITPLKLIPMLRPPIIVSKITTQLPRRHILKPVFNSLEDFNPLMKPVISERRMLDNGDFYRNYVQFNRKPDQNKTRKNDDLISKILSARRSGNPINYNKNKRVNLNIQYFKDLPYYIPPVMKAHLLRDKVESVRSYIYENRLSERRHFKSPPKVETSAGVAVDGLDSVEHVYYSAGRSPELGQKPAIPPLKFTTPKKLDTETALAPSARVTRPKKTIFFLSPTLPYNRLF